MKSLPPTRRKLIPAKCRKGPVDSACASLSHQSSLLVQLDVGQLELLLLQPSSRPLQPHEARQRKPHSPLFIPRHFVFSDVCGDEGSGQAGRRWSQGRPTSRSSSLTVRPTTKTRLRGPSTRLQRRPKTSGDSRRSAMPSTHACGCCARSCRCSRSLEVMLARWSR